MGVKQSKSTLNARKALDTWRNNATTPPSASTPTLNQQYVYTHRKGAAPTYDPATHLALTNLPFPGSRGKPVLVLTPNFSAYLHTSSGPVSVLSLAHGAERSVSLAKALLSLSQKRHSLACFSHALEMLKGCGQCAMKRVWCSKRGVGRGSATRCVKRPDSHDMRGKWSATKSAR